MGNESNMQELLLKFLREECTREEIEELLAYVKSTKDIEGMPSFGDVLSLLDEVPDMEYGKSQAIYSTILEQGRRQSRTSSRKGIIRYASVAAIFIGILTLGYFYQQDVFDASTEDLSIPANEAITLQLEDGTIEVIDLHSNKEVRDGKGNLVANQERHRLNYMDTGGGVKELVYNTLTVPYGKRFDVVLSDGTTVFMNSGTELKYPVAFLKKGNREVFVQGEAYFDVTSDKRPFVVNASELNVEVFGTEFNVLAYPEDNRTNVVLVEGSVGLQSNASKKTITLDPGEKSLSRTKP